MFIVKDTAEQPVSDNSNWSCSERKKDYQKEAHGRVHIVVMCAVELHWQKWIQRFIFNGFYKKSKEAL